ncbi:PD-(D/E)XK nuclease family protein [Paenibacillus sp. Marseille-Q9583]
MFFKEAIGKRVTQAKHLKREVPFNFGLTAGDIYPDVVGPTANEVILIQGVIDCLFEDERGLVLLDFKSDSTKGKTEDELEGKYRLQLKLYERAIVTTWKVPVIEKYLYYFDGSKLIRVS